MADYSYDEHQIRNLNYPTLRQIANLLFVPSLFDLFSIYRNLHQAQPPWMKDYLNESVGYIGTIELLKIKDNLETRAGYIEPEEIIKKYGKTTELETKKTLMLKYVDGEMTKFIDLVRDAVEAKDLEVYAWHDDFLLCKFRRHSIFHWMGNIGTVDNLKEMHLIIAPLLNKMIEKHRKPPPTPEASAQPEQEPLPDDDIIKITFSKNGDQWEVGVDKTAMITHIIGMAYIDHVLRRPKEGFPCILLARLKDDRVPDESREGVFEEDERGSTTEVSGIPDDQIYKGKNLDEESYKKQKELVLELKADLDKTKDNAPEIEVLQDDYKKQTKILTSMFDKKGNPRDDSSPETKARKNVSRAIIRAIERITAILPDMRDHLKHIQMGNEIVFLPPEGPKYRIK